MGSKFTSVCVYCGSAAGLRSNYESAAREMGRMIALHPARLVYGGGRVGLMGSIADSVLSCGGEVVGVIPKALMERELGHLGIQSLHIVRDMHERKNMMASLADAFIAMPGGWGTMEELTEMLTWLQLGIHNKPIGLLNIDGYYDGLLQFALHMANEGFVRPPHRDLLCVESDPEQLLEKMCAKHACAQPDWNPENNPEFLPRAPV